MANYDAWVNNSPYYTFDVWKYYWDNGNSWGYGTRIGGIYSGEVFYKIRNIVHPGGGDTMYEVLFMSSSGSWTVGYMNEYDCQNAYPAVSIGNLSTLEKRFNGYYSQVEYVNGKKLVWARTNRSVAIYNGSGQYLFSVPADRKLAKDMTNYATFQCGATHRDWLTFTHWYDPTISNWRYLQDGGGVCFGAVNMGNMSNYAINIW